MLVLTDISPEEVRYSVYEAKKVNRFFEEVIKIKNIKKIFLSNWNFNLKFQQFQQKQNQVVDLLNQIANPNQEMRDYLVI